MASTTWPTPAAEADRIAAEWEEALQRFGRACERLRGLTPRSATLRWILSPIARRVAAATSDAHRDLWLAKQLVQDAFLGAGWQWGVLSGGHSRAGELRLETTLTELVAEYRDVAPCVGADR